MLFCEPVVSFMQVKASKLHFHGVSHVESTIGEHSPSPFQSSANSISCSPSIRILEHIHSHQYLSEKYFPSKGTEDKESSYNGLAAPASCPSNTLLFRFKC